MDNIKYCIFCGAKNSADADTCAVCGKTMHPKENLLKEYLYRKTKARLKGKAEDSFLSVLKNWILSHLYGLVVTISVIVVAVSHFSGASQVPSYVRTIRTDTRPGEQTALPAPANNAEKTQTAALTVTQDDIDEVAFLLYQYGSRYFEERARATGGYVEEDEADLEMDRSSTADCLVPSSYGYNGAIEYYELTQETFRYDEVMTLHDDPLINAPTTELGRRILADGHPVMEYIAPTTYSGENGSMTITFKYVAVKLDGKWYFAEILEQ